LLRGARGTFMRPASCDRIAEDLVLFAAENDNLSQFWIQTAPVSSAATSRCGAAA